MSRKKNGELEIVEERQITYGRNSTIYHDDVDIIGNYEPSGKKVKGNEGLVDLADNPFPEDADSESFVKEDSENEERKKPRIHSES